MKTYSITCADSGAACPASFTTETEGELMQHLEVHAKASHPDMKMDDETIAQIKGLVKVS